MNAEFFSGNRQALMQKVQGAPVVLTAYASLQRSNDTAHFFEQESNFWYLAGIEDPDWVVVIDGSKSWLIAPDIDEIHRIFDGGISFDEAKRISGVTDVLSHDDGDVLLRDLAKKHSIVYTLGKDPYQDHYNFSLNPAPTKLFARLERLFASVSDVRKDLNILRAIKQPIEIVAMKKAVKLTTQAFEYVYSQLDSYRYEYEVEADFSHFFRKNGAKGHAYEPIVAGGANAVTLHYVKNDQRLKKGSLLLLDIGARVDGYAADITRTYAVGTLSARAKAVHAAVKQAQERIITLLKPGLSVQDYGDAVDETMKEALKSLDLLKTDDDYRTYFPHAVSHGLGIDVHDSLAKAHEFQPGMVLTVEPGIYIPEAGIGVRIEDDILITDKGYENLSTKLSTDL